MRSRGGQGAPAHLRCAIYTRKSTEEGLDQEFNSLDAQREACAAYILSQRHEGWVLHAEHYDDGGFSGGNMERPGLKRLLADVAAGKVDVIVVYKVDRLTRALSDFSRIVDTLDAAGASFVSITQAFNTTTSMGRLTLNVLLSFAQFEREVISERVRDKVAASKAKGMWMGGPVPLGYIVQDRKLIVHNAEAATVQYIMQRYLELKSVKLLQRDLRDAGIVTKIQQLRDGTTRGGVPFTRGTLYHLLKNRIYRGDIMHKGTAHAGEHAAIISEELFAAVQQQIAENSVARSCSDRSANPSLLAGMIRDAEGRPLTPSHAVKQGRRYRYYVSNVPQGSGSAIRLPAAKLEKAVVNAVKSALGAHDIFASHMQTLDASDISRLRIEIERIHASMAGSTTDVRAMLVALDLRVVVHVDRIEASLSQDLLLAMCAGQPTDAHHRLDVAIQTSTRRRGHEIKLKFAAQGKDGRDDKLVDLIVRAYAARSGLADAGGSTSERRERLRLARLSFLAPDIVTAIFQGRHPASLTVRALTRVANLPLCWNAQRRLLLQL